MNKWIVTALLAVVPYTTPAVEYSAGLEHSIWQVATATPIECALEHPIPRYGKARFLVSASREINLQFELKMKREMPRIQNVSLESVPPRWKPGHAQQALETLTFYQQFDGQVHGQTAWVMLEELARGYFPTFLYNDWYAGDKPTSVALSSVNFATQYADFLNCIDNLLPYSFEDISFTVLTFRANTDELTSESQRRLDMVTEYLKYMPQAVDIDLSAYSDSYGGDSANQLVTERRANSLREYLIAQGIDEERITSAAWGEKRHIAVNDMPLERQKNQRIVLALTPAIL